MKKMSLVSMLVFLTLNTKAFAVETYPYQQIDKYDRTEDSYSDIDKYTKSEIAADFLEKFKKDTDKKDFKRLREYLREKEDLFEALKNELMLHNDNSKQSQEYDIKIKKLSKLIEKKKPSEKIKINPEYWDYETYIYDKFIIESKYSTINKLIKRIDENGMMEDYYIKTVEEISEMIAKYTIIKQELDTETKIVQTLNKNIKIVKQDIYDCRSQIDSALAPEYKEQEFRSKISIYFTILIGLLLVIFFFIVYRRSGNNLSKELLSGNGLQFITLFVLIIAVILFGILSILQGSELAAILAGISGYILGKGVPENKITDIPHNSKSDSVAE